MACLTIPIWWSIFIIFTNSVFCASCVWQKTLLQNNENNNIIKILFNTFSFYLLLVNCGNSHVITPHREGFNCKTKIQKDCEIIYFVLYFFLVTKIRVFLIPPNFLPIFFIKKFGGCFLVCSLPLCCRILQIEY
jgi:hypothetical protein